MIKAARQQHFVQVVLVKSHLPQNAWFVLGVEALKPILFQWGSFSITSYFFMYLVAILTAALFFYAVGRREGLQPSILIDLILFTTFAGIVGGKLFHLLSHFNDYKVILSHHLWDQFWRSGYISYGAILGVTAAVWLYLKIRHEKVGNYLDLCYLTAPIVIFFVRLGCLLTGCCFGKPTDFFIHLTFTSPLTKAGSFYPGVPLHATQVYGMLKAVLLFGILEERYRKRRYAGEVTLLFFILYPLFRFLIEFLRGDPGRSYFFGGTLTSAQVVMIPLFVSAVITYLILSQHLRTACNR